MFKNLSNYFNLSLTLALFAGMAPQMSSANTADARNESQVVRLTGESQNLSLTLQSKEDNIVREVVSVPYTCYKREFSHYEYQRRCRTDHHRRCDPPRRECRIIDGRRICHEHPGRCYSHPVRRCWNEQVPIYRNVPYTCYREEVREYVDGVAFYVNANVNIEFDASQASRLADESIELRLSGDQLSVRLKQSSGQFYLLLEKEQNLTVVRPRPEGQKSLQSTIRIRAVDVEEFKKATINSVRKSGDQLIFELNGLSELVTWSFQELRMSTVFLGNRLRRAGTPNQRLEFNADGLATLTLTYAPNALRRVKVGSRYSTTLQLKHNAEFLNPNEMPGQNPERQNLNQRMRVE